MNYQDSDIISLCRDAHRRREGFTLLMKVYSERLYVVIRRLVVHHEDTHDVLQNTFLKAWQGLDRFRGDARIATWLYRIATNEAITYLQKRKRNAWQELPESDQAASTSHADDISAEKKLEKLQQAIEMLPEKQKAVFVLRYYEEMPYEIMSEVMGTSVGALKASYHHAVKKIEHFILSN